MMGSSVRIERAKCQALRTHRAAPDKRWLPMSKAYSPPLEPWDRIPAEMHVTQFHKYADA
jgi:hypothetical protein